MLDGGADLELIRLTFRAVFERQKEAGRGPPSMLRYMRDPIAEARMPDIPGKDDRRGGNGADTRNPSDVQREARIASYNRAVAEGREPYWDDDSGWGPRPDAEPPEASG